MTNHERSEYPHDSDLSEEYHHEVRQHKSPRDSDLSEEHSHEVRQHEYPHEHGHRPSEYYD
ncbi:MAG: hypothetical protein AAGJ82_10505 [Bacteroidota bacterium]